MNEGAHDRAPLSFAVFHLYVQGRTVFARRSGSLVEYSLVVFVFGSLLSLLIGLFHGC